MRKLVAFLALSVMTIWLAACSTPHLPTINFNTALSQGAGDAQLVQTALNANLPRIATIPGISPGTVAQVGGIVSDLRAVPPLISRAQNISGAQTAVAELAKGLDGLFGTSGALAGVTLPAIVNNVKGASYVLLGSIQANVGSAVSAVPPPVPAGVSQLSPDDARALLKNGG